MEENRKENKLSNEELFKKDDLTKPTLKGQLIAGKVEAIPGEIFGHHMEQDEDGKQFVLNIKCPELADEETLNMKFPVDYSEDSSFMGITTLFNLLTEDGKSIKKIENAIPMYFMKCFQEGCIYSEEMMKEFEQPTAEEIYGLLTASNIQRGIIYSCELKEKQEPPRMILQIAFYDVPYILIEVDVEAIPHNGTLFHDLCNQLGVYDEKENCYDLSSIEIRSDVLVEYHFNQECDFCIDRISKVDEVEVD